MSTSKPRVAILGLGVMGTGMANNLLRAGYPVTVYNRNAAKALAFAGAGALIASSPRAAAADADVIVSMVADDVASRAVWQGEEGVLAGVGQGALLIESSTLTVGWVEELAAAATAAGCELIDAPVTGSKVQATAGELLFLVGGSAEALERARPVLEAMSRAIVHVGPVGSGARMKLVNNFVCGVQAVAMAEAIAMIERSGLDVKTAIDVLLTGAPGSPLAKTMAARMTERAYTPANFTMRLMRKDLTYARDEAARHGVALDSVTNALALFDRAIADGHSEDDFAAIIEPLRSA